jgi:gluconate 2-dehydrogenase gamma chain
VVELARRELLQSTAALGLTVALGSYAVARPAGDSKSSYLFFTRDEAAFVEAAVDRLIPSDPEWPGARELGVPSYIDLQLAGPYGAGERLYLQGPIKKGFPGQGYQLGLTPAELYRKSLATISAELKKRAVDFASASPGDKDAFLTGLERGELTIDGFSSAIFFETLLANTVEGFFGDPAYGGNRDMTAWRMIGFPGAYAAYLEVYTQHGIAFDRAPIAMTDAGHGHHQAPAGTGRATQDRR